MNCYLPVTPRGAGLKAGGGVGRARCVPLLPVLFGVKDPVELAAIILAAGLMPFAAGCQGCFVAHIDVRFLNCVSTRIAWGGRRPVDFFD